MEISFLNFEILWWNDMTAYMKGKTIYDPMDKTLVFYDKDENLLFTKKIETLQLIPNYLKEFKLAFRDEDGDRLFVIECDKKETLELRSFRFLYNRILSIQNKASKLEKYDSKYIVSKAKDYQLEILESAKQRNTIVFLETGLGKTYISVLLIKHLFGEPVASNISNPISYKKESNKKVIFLFKTISLLIQQAKVLKYNTNLRVIKLYGGQDGNNAPPFKKFRGIVDRYDIICATPETIYRYFSFGYISHEDLNLIVLDECHHAKDRDFYNLILKHYVHPYSDNKVKILGLTASPSFDSEKSEEKITENIQNLCNNMNCYLTCPFNIIKDTPYLDSNSTSEKEINFIFLDKFANETTQMKEIKLFFFQQIILPFVTSYLKLKTAKTFGLSQENYEPLFFSTLFTTLFCDEDKISEKTIGIFEKEDYDLLTKHFGEFGLTSICVAFFEKFKYEAEKVENDKVNFSREMRDLHKKTQDDFALNEIRKLAKNINLILKYVDLYAVVDHSLHLFENLKKFFMQVFHSHNEVLAACQAKIEQGKKMFKNYRSVYLYSLEDFFSGIINNLSDNQSTGNPKSIVFINQRIITKLLNEKMNKFLLSKGYSSKFVVGCQSQSSIPFSEEELKVNIDYFTSNPNCLVLFATNVVEEGIDVPQCNNVINLTEIKSIKEYIQKSGRARKADSRIFLCCESSEVDKYKEKIEQIKISIKVMKSIILENKLEPKVKKEKLISGVNYYQTVKGARVYLSYAKKIIEEFIGKLFYDGYTFIRAALKLDEIKDTTGKIMYKPYLSLPSVLEANFIRISDHDEVLFTTKDEATKYFNKYEDYYYMKAVKLLHLNHYFNDHLMFSKNYDDLMMVENSYSKLPCEPQLKLKFYQESKSETEAKLENPDETVEVVAHILNISPNYIDINYENGDANAQKVLAIISDTPLTLINFDLYIHSTLLLKLYHFNTAFDDSEENKKKFQKKPKIPYNIFTKLNVAMNEYQAIQVKKSDIPLINFLYTYLLFSSTDAELFFYFSLHTRKFDFAESLFLSDKKTRTQLEFIFDKYVESIPGTKKHLQDLKNAQMDYSNHIIKFSLLNKMENGQLFFDLSYIKKMVTSVKDEIAYYYHFLTECVEGVENIKRMNLDQAFLGEKEKKLIEKRESTELAECGSLARNMINYGKMFVMNYGSTDLRGTTDYKKNQSYQMYFLEKYGVLTDRYRDYKKCLPLDYNQKVLKYKVNMNQLGKVSKAFHCIHYLKKFNFMPNEVIQPIKLVTIDQLHMFTLLPLILFKVQHSLIYYYQAHCLRQRFSSFKSLPQMDIKLFTQSLNAKSTLEMENYERLEFLGDAVLKLLSSLEVCKIYPDGNRDLLYSQRRALENNKVLYNFAIKKENKLDEFLFTNPMTIRRVKVPGFNKDEALVFNIGYNKSFAKNCFFQRQIEQKLEEEDATFKGIELSCFNMDFLGKDVQLNPEKFIDEEKTDKTVINITYENNEEPKYDRTEVLIDDHLIEEVVNKKIEVVPSKNFRILYNKVLADLVESLTGFLLHSTLYNELNCYDMFERSSLFLKEIGLLTNKFSDLIGDPYWLNNLVYEKCRFQNEQKYMKVRFVAENGRYNFKNIELLYQACTHPSYLSDESIKANFPYVKKSYSRLAFIGEAFTSFYVSLWVYSRNIDATEGLLHKLKICGINHHITSLIAIDLKLDDCLLKNDKDLDTDLKIYKNKFLEMRSQSENKFKIENENVLDENFMIILCELFHAYIGAILLDSQDVEKTFLVLKGIMDEYLGNHATKSNYTEHPKVVILDEFMRRRNYFNKIRENGSNRINMKNEKQEKFRKLKMYKYQLIIDKFIIYEEYIYYNRSTIKIAQEKAKDIFLRVCHEIDKREKLGMHMKYFDLEKILIHLGILYEKIQIN